MLISQTLTPLTYYDSYSFFLKLSPVQFSMLNIHICRWTYCKLKAKPSYQANSYTKVITCDVNENNNLLYKLISVRWPGVLNARSQTRPTTILNPVLKKPSALGPSISLNHDQQKFLWKRVKLANFVKMRAVQFDKIALSQKLIECVIFSY